NYRAYFTRCAFSVVDCPPMTGYGKNSTDIHMVMDILDALKHETRFDEFIILSGDSDFTPVLLRLRMHDRRTVILTSGPVAQAYKAAADLVVSAVAFIEDGLRIMPEAASETRVRHAEAIGKRESKVLDAIAKRFYEEVSTEGRMLATRLPQILG